MARARRAELAPRIALLAACDLFEQVDDGDLTQLAGAAEELALGSGEVVVAEGEPADAFYVLVDGTLRVTSSTAADDPRPGRRRPPRRDRTDRAGPRTATVTAATDARLLRFPGDAFLEALTAHKPSVAFMEGAAQRLRRTHPTLRAAARRDHARGGRMTDPDRSDLRAVLSSTRTLFGAAACSCALTSDDGASLTFVAADGAGAAEIVGVSIPVNTRDRRLGGALGSADRDRRRRS